MTEQEFRVRYEAEKHIYQAWGEYVSKTILDTIKNDGIDPHTLLKIISIPRVKDTESIIAKAFYRGKDYQDSYLQITDKVGTRFVALLEEDIKTICSIIESREEWNTSKDRDYEAERESEPLRFDYQSMHYVVSAKIDINHNGVIIPMDTPCEIQVRTLLQHAYSELTHDRVYKSKFDPTGNVKRTVARSMAFLETTDEFFQKVSNEMSEIPVFQLYDILKHKIVLVFPNFIESHKANVHILQCYLDRINTGEFINSSIFDEFDPIVKANITSTFFNSQPVIYFIYYMCQYHRSEVKEKWGLTTNELRPYFTHLGISMSDRN